MDLQEPLLLWPPAAGTETCMEDVIEVGSQKVGTENGMGVGVGREWEGKRDLVQEGERVKE